MNDLWSRLCSARKPLVMYGTGNGADRIVAVLEEKGLVISDYFASDDFVRGQYFHGKKVLGFDEIKVKYNDFIIIVGFASERREVLDTIYGLDGKYELYMPEVPVVGNNLFDGTFYEAHREELSCVANMLTDDESRHILNSVIQFRLTGKISFLRDSVSSRDEIYSHVLSPERYVVCADLGAYTGDTAGEMQRNFPNVKKIIAFEPDEKNYRRLCLRSPERSGCEILPVNAAAWNENTTITFSAEGNRNSGAFTDSKSNSVRARTLDSLLRGDRCDFIKFDVEGSEYHALQGCCKTIAGCSPDLAISLYHRSEDIFRLVLCAAKLCPTHRLYIRRPEYLPAWDLCLYAVK